MAEPDLFHVTTKWKADNILKYGMMTAFPSSENQGAIEGWMDVKGYDEITPEILDEYYEDESFGYGYELSAEEWARRKLDDLLPDHSHSLFFWANENRAKSLKRNMESRKYSNEDYVVLGIDSDMLEDEPYMADFDLSDEIFSELESIFRENLSYEEESERMEEIYGMVEDYEKSKRKYSGEDGRDVEVLYPHSISREAIVTYDGRDVSIDSNQRRLDSFKSKGQGRGWWGEPIRHKLASNGIQTTYRGDKY